jgi:hypothetical protein
LIYGHAVVFGVTETASQQPSLLACLGLNHSSINGQHECMTHPQASATCRVYLIALA